MASPTVPIQDAASYSVSTAFMNDTLISIVESPHSIRSRNTAMISHSFNPMERDTSVPNVEESISNTLWHCPDQFDDLANKTSVSTLLEPITRHSTLSVRNTSVAFGEYDVEILWSMST